MNSCLLHNPGGGTQIFWCTHARQRKRVKRGTFSAIKIHRFSAKRGHSESSGQTRLGGEFPVFETRKMHVCQTCFGGSIFTRNCAKILV